MGTFVTTHRMAPELAERVRASVRGKRTTPRTTLERRARWKPGLVALARVGALLTIVVVFSSVAMHRRHEAETFEGARAALLATVHAASAQLTPRDDAAESRMEAWLVKASAGYDGDFVAGTLRSEGALSEVLARPSVYVRGALAQLATPQGIALAAAASANDPLLACLVDPPTTRAEKALLAKVHGTYGGDLGPHLANVRRLREVQLGLPYLTPAWAANVEHAQTVEELDVFAQTFGRAPIESARRGAKAALLIVAIDEPGDAGEPTELDGENAHPVRVELVDLASEKLLLRMRKRVDPSGISAEKRPLYAGGIDSCALALDVRESVIRVE